MVLQNAGWDLGERLYLELFKNGVVYSDLDRVLAWATSTQSLTSAGSDIIDLVAGDYIDIRASQNSGAGVAYASNTRVSIERIK